MAKKNVFRRWLETLIALIVALVVFPVAVYKVHKSINPVVVGGGRDDSFVFFAFVIVVIVVLLLAERCCV